MGRLNVGLPKGQRGTFDYFYQSMRAAVPLIRQKNELDYRKGVNDLNYQVGLQQLQQETEKAKFEAAEKTMQERIKAAEAERKRGAERLGEYTKGARTAGDEPAALAGQQAEVKAGLLPPGLPSFVGEEDSLTKAELAMRAAKGDLEAQQALDKLEPDKQGRAPTEIELIQNLTPEKFQEYVKRKGQLRKTDQPKNPTEAQFLLNMTPVQFETYKNRKKAITKPSAKAKPEGYNEDLSAGLKALEQGADPEVVYNMLSQKYTGQAKELQALIMAKRLPKEVQSRLKDAVNRLQGESPKLSAEQEYQNLASEYPEYREALKGILLTPKTDDIMKAFAGMFK